ncbi:PKD domain-containing protein [Aurantibacillus circumpalustris]|uniref:PKD domain-containing protein n=1 Tax=Aurantibacillus circumpalustris TaxID=3036359 RepID=UPI00295B1B10|nr:PKD domain-containing protein [Aurantibacillus circumpalustris]
MKVLKFLCVFFLFVGLLSCNKKEYPKPQVTENSPVFYSKLTINNQALELQAGIDGYYMYSSYEVDSNFVKTFVADLKQKDCSNCANSLKIEIKDYQVSLSNPSSNIDSALHKGQYPILAGSPAPTYSLQFFGSNDNTSTWDWDFGDGTNSVSQNPIHFYKTLGKHRVCLTTTSNNNYKSSNCNYENVNPNGLIATISASEYLGNSMKFSSNVIGGRSPYQYLWNFGNGQISTLNSENISYTYQGAYAVNLRVVDFYGDTAYAAYNAKTINDVSSSAANYTVTPVKKIAPEPPLSQVLISWTDDNGTVYTSNTPLQPSQSYFQIYSVSENERNENSQTTKKITAKFSCILYSGIKAIAINDAEVVISVAY